MSQIVHPNALVESEHIGDGTRIWAFAHILPGAVVGRDCNVCDQVFIENDVVIGDRVTVKCGVQLWDGLRVEDDVFIGPNATFTNDLFPRSGQRPDRFLPTVLRKGASIGANATILAGVEIGQNAMVGAGAVVTRNVPANAQVVGNPARITRYLTTSPTEGEAVARLEAESEKPTESGVAGVTVQMLPFVKDLRGLLSFAECGQHLPFEPRRYFIVFDVPSKELRGEHAHRVCQQFLICVKGSCSVLVDDAKNRAEFVLDRPNFGVYVPPMVWAAQYNYSPDAVLLVLASHPYDAADYIRDYDQYIALMADR